jgi:hypothetical protein
MKNEITLTIHLSELRKIVSGEKKEEYRAAKAYYFKLFEAIDDNAVVKNPCKTILFRCANQNINFFARVSIKEIVYEQFFGEKKPIPENFNLGDIAFTIYIDKVIEHNLS